MQNNFFNREKETSTDIWLTPPDIINSLGTFDLDPCCPNNLSWKTANTFYSIENGQNGLLLEWWGRVWLNPPYSDWVSFIKKLKEHGNGIALIFARTETKGFFEHIWEDADSILFLKRRIKFIRHDLSKCSSSTAPSVLIAYGKNNTISLEKSGLEGKLIKLK